MILGALSAIELAARILGGGLADTLSRRRTLNGAMMGALVANGVLASLLTGTLLVNRSAQSHGVWLFAVVLGTAGLAAFGAGLADPVLDSSLKMLISPVSFPRAMSAAQARSAVISIIASPGTGMLYGFFPSLPFVFRVGAQATFLTLLKRIPEHLGPPTTAPVHSRWGVVVLSIRGYRESLRFLHSRPVLFRFLLSSPLVNVMVFTGMMWCVFYLGGLGQPAWVIGSVLAGFAVGSILGSTVTGLLTDHIGVGWLAIAGLTTMVVCFGLLLLTSHEPMVMFLLAVACMFPSPPLNGAIFGYLFTVTDAQMRGRVIATFMAIGGLASALAPMVAGLMVSSAPSAFVALAVCAVGTLGVILLASSGAVRRLPLLGETPDHSWAQDS